MKPKFTMPFFQYDVIQGVHMRPHTLKDHTCNANRGVILGHLLSVSKRFDTNRSSVFLVKL